jgi:hypothetical protein
MIGMLSICRRWRECGIEEARKQPRQRDEEGKEERKEVGSKLTNRRMLLLTVPEFYFRM